MENTKHTFKDVCKEYENSINLYGLDTKNENVQDSIINLATAVTSAVLKKIYDASADPTIRKIRNGLASDRNKLAREQNLLNSITYTVTYDRDGNEQIVSSDKQKDADIARLVGTACHGDGLSLVSYAVGRLIELTLESFERFGKPDPQNPDIESINLFFVERPYTVRKAKKQVQIVAVGKPMVSIQFVDCETCLIRELYRSIRYEIMKNGNISTDARNGYLYIESLVTDDETGTETAVYKRMPRYADIGGNVCFTHDGTTPQSYSLDSENAGQAETLISILAKSLTNREKLVVSYRFKGVSVPKIAEKLNVSERTIQRILVRIQKICIENGYDPTPKN